MRRSIRASLGATLLEVMLVLSIIALIILMSVRYYQATSNASQAEQLTQVIQAITASADNLAMGNSAGYLSATSTNIKGLSGSSVLTDPFGGSITVSTASATSYTVTVPGAPTNVCNNVSNKLKSNTKYNMSCASTGMTYTYNSSS